MLAEPPLGTPRQLAPKDVEMEVVPPESRHARLSRIVRAG